LGLGHAKHSCMLCPRYISWNLPSEGTPGSNDQRRVKRRRAVPKEASTDSRIRHADAREVKSSSKGERGLGLSRRVRRNIPRPFTASDKTLARKWFQGIRGPGFSCPSRLFCIFRVQTHTSLIGNSEPSHRIVTKESRLEKSTHQIGFCVDRS
jgi:hypothetical protein